MSVAVPHPRPCAAALLGLLLAACAAASAYAASPRSDSTTSKNWSGYALHPSGVKFRRMSGEWRQPSASCGTSSSSYSSFWVGIGGYRKTSDALEQIGTELDCNAYGSSRSYAWYELVPAASHVIRMPIASGAVMRASVSISGNAVTIALSNLTTGARFSRTIKDHTLDQTSAEWIAEAPSNCTSSSCSALPLADFGTARFLRTSAATTTGVTRSLANAPWTPTRIILDASFKSEATNEAGETTTSESATPSLTSSNLGAFDVVYTASSSTTPTTTTTTPTTGGGGNGGGGDEPPSSPPSVGGGSGGGSGGGPGGPSSFRVRELVRR